MNNQLALDYLAKAMQQLDSIRAELQETSLDERTIPEIAGDLLNVTENDVAKLTFTQITDYLRQFSGHVLGEL